MAEKETEPNIELLSGGFSERLAAMLSPLINQALGNFSKPMNASRDLPMRATMMASQYLSGSPLIQQMAMPHLYQGFGTLTKSFEGPSGSLVLGSGSISDEFKSRELRNYNNKIKDAANDARFRYLDGISKESGVKNTTARFIDHMMYGKEVGKGFDVEKFGYRSKFTGDYLDIKPIDDNNKRIVENLSKLAAGAQSDFYKNMSDYGGNNGRGVRDGIKELIKLGEFDKEVQNMTGDDAYINNRRKKGILKNTLNKFRNRPDTYESEDFDALVLKQISDLGLNEKAGAKLYKEIKKDLKKGEEAGADYGAISKSIDDKLQTALDSVNAVDTSSNNNVVKTANEKIKGMLNSIQSMREYVDGPQKELIAELSKFAGDSFINTNLGSKSGIEIAADYATDISNLAIKANIDPRSMLDTRDIRAMLNEVGGSDMSAAGVQLYNAAALAAGANKSSDFVDNPHVSKLQKELFTGASASVNAQMMTSAASLMNNEDKEKFYKKIATMSEEGEITQGDIVEASGLDGDRIYRNMGSTKALLEGRTNGTKSLAMAINNSAHIFYNTRNTLIKNKLKGMGVNATTLEGLDLGQNDLEDTQDMVNKLLKDQGIEDEVNVLKLQNVVGSTITGYTNQGANLDKLFQNNKGVTQNIEDAQRDRDLKEQTRKGASSLIRMFGSIDRGETYRETAAKVIGKSTNKEYADAIGVLISGDSDTELKAFNNSFKKIMKDKYGFSENRIDSLKNSFINNNAKTPEGMVTLSNLIMKGDDVARNAAIHSFVQSDIGDVGAGLIDVATTDQLDKIRGSKEDAGARNKAMTKVIKDDMVNSLFDNKAWMKVQGFKKKEEVADALGDADTPNELLRNAKRNKLTNGLNDNDDFSQTTRDVANDSTVGATAQIADTVSDILKEIQGMVIKGGDGKSDIGSILNLLGLFK